MHTLSYCKKISARFFCARMRFFIMIHNGEALFSQDCQSGKKRTKKHHTQFLPVGNALTRFSTQSDFDMMNEFIFRLIIIAFSHNPFHKRLILIKYNVWVMIRAFLNIRNPPVISTIEKITKRKSSNITRLKTLSPTS